MTITPEELAEWTAVARRLAASASADDFALAMRDLAIAGQALPRLLAERAEHVRVLTERRAAFRRNLDAGGGSARIAGQYDVLTDILALLAGQP